MVGNFDEKYKKYIEKLKNEIPYVLGNKHHDFQRDFEHKSNRSTHIEDIVAVLWFVLAGVGAVIIGLITEDTKIPINIFFIVWLGIGVLWLLFGYKYKNAISDYFFYKYEYKKIIEDRIERDKQQEIKAVLRELFKNDSLDFADLDVYERKLGDIEYFYDRCLMEIKYEHFEEKI